MMQYGVFGPVLAFVLVSAALCRAQEAPAAAEPSPSSVQVQRWYGWQTFTSDGIAAGLFVGAIAHDRDPALLGTSALVFELGAPVVHLAHGHWEYALCSLGLRAATPLLGIVIGSQFDNNASVDDSSADQRSAKWATMGAAFGGLAASLLDGFILAYEQDAAPPAKPQRNELLKVEAFPSLRVLPRGALLGLSGSL
ncbi:MAG: hypothetical protein ABJB12_08530 [Pseudomonadota bacterium]